MNSEAEKYVQESLAKQEPASATPTEDPQPGPAVLPTSQPGVFVEIPARLLEMRAGRKTTELAVLVAASALVGAAFLLGQLGADAWAYCQTALAGVYIHSRGQAKQRRR